MTRIDVIDFDVFIAFPPSNPWVMRYGKQGIPPSVCQVGSVSGTQEKGAENGPRRALGRGTPGLSGVT